MKNLILTLLLTLLSSNMAFSHNKDTLDKILQVQTTEAGDVFYLLQKNINYDSFTHQHTLVWYIKCLTEQGQSSSIILLDTMTTGWGYLGRGNLFKGPGGVYVPSIFFIDENVGFVYGNFKSYGDKPFILRTTDGGKSWQKTDSLPYNTFGIRRSDFSMLDTQHGFLLMPYMPHQIGLKDSISYFITKNQGQTWQPKKIPIEQEDYTLMKCDVQFYKYGHVTIVAYLENKMNLKKAIIFQSSNFGETFSTFK